MWWNARSLKPSTRGELEITDVNRAYLAQGLLDVQVMGAAWPGSIPVPTNRCSEASQFIQTIEKAPRPKDCLSGRNCLPDGVYSCPAKLRDSPKFWVKVAMAPIYAAWLSDQVF